MKMAACMGRSVSHVLEIRRQSCRYSFQWYSLPIGTECNVIHSNYYSSDSKDKPLTDTDKKKTSTKPQKQLSEKQVAALEKLNSLLKNMKVSRSGASERPRSTLNLAKPERRLKEVERRLMMAEQQREEEVEKSPKKLEAFGSPMKDSELDPDLLQAVTDVASSLGGDIKITESELLSKLREHGKQVGSSEKVNLSDVFVGMKIERSKTPPDSRQYPVSSRLLQSTDSNDRAAQAVVLGARRQQRARAEMRTGSRTKIDLFGSGTLNIFSRSDFETKEKPIFPELKLWDKLDENELQLQVLHPPKNSYEELIRWTEQNKLWKFPIDNEAGLEDESKVSFHEHVFLDHLLEEGFPKKGPIRHFMELVITGLSKNHYLSVQQKHDHVAWFRNYFKDKEEILKAVGAA